MEDETKGVNEAWQKVAPLLSLSEQERLKYLSELQEPQLSELQASLNEVSGYVERRLRKEATWTNRLKERLEKEGWQIKRFAPDKQRGPDIKAEKEKDNAKRTIFIEVKGEPSPSAKSVPAVRHKNVNDALGDIVNQMRTQSGDIRYCIAFPNTYLKLVKKRIPDLVRQKLDLYILFLKGESLKALYPTQEDETDLRGFDELFEK